MKTKSCPATTREPLSVQQASMSFRADIQIQPNLRQRGDNQGLKIAIDRVSSRWIRTQFETKPSLL